MSNFFSNVLGDLDSVETELLGPDYKYYKFIKTPMELPNPVTGAAQTSQIVYGVKGIYDYIRLLVTGQGDASKTGHPLGNKFFLKTGAKCSDIKTNQDVTRYIYINNVPTGNIPFISSGLGGVDFTEFEGLIPGTLSNLGRISPLEIFQAFLSGTDPSCQEIELETIDSNNNKSTEKQHLTNVDIENTDPCTFLDKTNPLTKVKCTEAFSVIEPDIITESADIIEYLFYISLILIVIYSLFKYKK